MPTQGRRKAYETVPFVLPNKPGITHGKSDAAAPAHLLFTLPDGIDSGAAGPACVRHRHPMRRPLPATAGPVRFTRVAAIGTRPSRIGAMTLVQEKFNFKNKGLYFRKVIGR